MSRRRSTSPATPPVVLSLPAWTPGAYEIEQLRALGERLRRRRRTATPLRWDKLDYDTWRVRPATARAGDRGVRLRGRHARQRDGVDAARLRAVQRHERLPVSRGPLDSTSRRRCRSRRSRDCRIATGMAPAARRARSRPPNYHDLVDMPFFVGQFDLDSATSRDKPVRFATYPRGSVAGGRARRRGSSSSARCPPEVRVFGEVAVGHLHAHADHRFDVRRGESGLEHQNSHVDIVAPPFVGSDFQPSLYAHEIFHAWNVKRLRPADLVPVPLRPRPQPTPWLWVSEGITDYYADLAKCAAASSTRRASTRSRRARSASTRRRFRSRSRTRRSTRGFTRATARYSYYPKGSLAGLMLDIMIRDASDNKHSLDT